MSRYGWVALIAMLDTVTPTDRSLARSPRAGQEDLDIDANDPIHDSLKDKNSPFWWRHIVGPAVDRVNQGLPPSRRVDQLDYLDVPQWCRFRTRTRRCMYPKHLDEQGTAEAGYDVWLSEDRGCCDRSTWQSQKECVVSEPGPESNEAVRYTDATRTWADGGWRSTDGLSIQRRERTYPVAAEVMVEKPPASKARQRKPTSRQPDYPGWRGKATVCSLCGQTVPLLVDGRVGAHGQPVQCEGTHARVAVADAFQLHPPYPTDLKDTTAAHQLEEAMLAAIPIRWSATEGLSYPCEICGFMIALNADGLLASHFKDGSTDAKGHHLVDRCEGSHAETPTAALVRETRNAAARERRANKTSASPLGSSKPPAKFRFGVLVVFELVVTLVFGIAGGGALLNSANSTDGSSPDSLTSLAVAFAISAGVLILTVAVWIWSLLSPGEKKAVALGVIAYDAVEARKHHDENAADRAKRDQG